MSTVEKLEEKSILVRANVNMYLQDRVKAEAAYILQPHIPSTGCLGPEKLHK